MATGLISPNTIRKNSIANENVDEKYFKVAIPLSENFKLIPIIGQDKYDQLLADQLADTLSPADTTLLDDYITPMLVQYCMEKIVVKLNNQVSAIGTTDDSNQGGTSLSPKDTYRTAHEYKSDAEAYATRLVNYMCEEGIQVFNSKTFTVPIYGGRTNNNRTTFISGNRKNS